MKHMIRFLALIMVLCTVTACGNAADVVNSVAMLSATMLDVKMGETASVSVINYDGEIRWISSDTSVAAVSDTGEIKPVSIGSVAITAVLENGETMNCVVDVLPGESSVKEIKVTSYYTDVSDITVNYNDSDTVRLKAICSPVDSVEKIAWSSADDSIAKVSDDGVVTVYGNGIVDIVATALNGVSGSCKLRVKNVPEEVEKAQVEQDIPVIEITQGQAGLTSAVPVPSASAQSSVIINEQRVYLKVGEHVKLNYAVSNTSNTTVSWISTDKSIAVVKDGYIVGVGNGTAIISAVTHDGAVASCKVAVGKEAINQLKQEVSEN